MVTIASTSGAYPPLIATATGIDRPGTARIRTVAPRASPSMVNPSRPSRSPSYGSGAGEIEHQVRPVSRRAPAAGAPAKRRQIFSSPVPSGKVTSRSLDLLPERKIVGAVQRHGEHARVAAENRRGAVALVHVTVDHRAPATTTPSRISTRAATATSLNTQYPSPRSLNAWCVPPARFAAAASSPPITSPSRGNRRPDRAPRPLDHLGRPRKPDPPLGLRRTACRSPPP